MKHRTAWTALALIASAASPAWSQALEGDTTDVITLQPVLVNVLRTPFPLTAAPFAVAVNTEAEIQLARPGLGLEEALGGIPGVQVDDRYNFALGDRISIRGFGARTQFGVRGVKVLVDGIPATLPDGQTNLNHVDFGFLRRAEVIRGPASSLWGNAAGGVVHFETQLPPAVPISQEFGFAAGSDGLLRLHSTTGGQSGGARYLLNVARLQYEGFRDFQDAENLQLNASVGANAAGGELRLTGSFVDYDANNPGSLNMQLLEADRTQASPNNLRFQTGESGRQGQLGAFWTREFGANALELSLYGITREIENPIPFTIIDLERSAGGVRASYSMPFGAPAWAANAVIGVEGDIQKDDRKNFRNDNGAVSDLRLDQAEQVLGGSIFSQLSAEPIPGLTAMAGIRYDATRFEAEDRFISATNPDDSGERTMDAVSPSIGLSYEFAEPFSLYGNVATSFETPTTTELTNRPGGAGGFNPELEPQRAVSFEIGAKGLLTDFATYQLSVYRTNVSDALIPFEIPENPGRSYFRNAGSAVHEGFEAGLTVVPMAGFRTNLAYTYIDATFDDYTVGTTSFAGNKIPGVSPHRLDASLNYTAPFGWYAGLDARYSDEIPVNDVNTAVSPSYVVVDLRTGLDRVRLGSLALEPFIGITNLLDEEYNTSVTVNAFGSRFFEPGPGRALYAGAQVRMDWQ